MSPVQVKMSLVSISISQAFLKKLGPFSESWDTIELISHRGFSYVIKV